MGGAGKGGRGGGGKGSNGSSKGSGARRDVDFASLGRARMLGSASADATGFTTPGATGPYMAHMARILVPFAPPLSTGAMFAPGPAFTQMFYNASMVAQPWCSSTLPVTCATPHYDGRMSCCVICMEAFRSDELLCRLGCRHTFHEGCYTLHRQQQTKEGFAECPVCRGAEPSIATFAFLGPDLYDENREATANLLTATVTIDRMQGESDQLRTQLLEESLNAEALELMHTRSTSKLRRLEEELDQLHVAHHSAMQRLKTLVRYANDGRHLALAKTTLSQIGGKCEKLDKNDGSLHDMAHAALAQNRKLAGRLASMCDQYSSALQTFDAAKTHLKTREREAVNNSNVARRELVALQGDMERREGEMTSELASCQRLVSTKSKELNDAKVLNAALVAKNHKLERNLLRTKTNATTFFNEKKKALAERDAAVDAKPLCASCLERDGKQLMVNLPCGHACSCMGCLDVSTPCPICRGAIVNAIPVYFAAE